MVVLVRMDHFPPLWMKYNGEYGCIGEDGPFSSSMNEVQRGIWLYWWGWTIFLLYEWSTTGNMVVLVRMDHFPPLWMKYNGEYGCIGEDGPFSSSMNEVQRGIWLYWWGWTIFLLYEWSTTGNMVVLVRMDHFPPLWMKYNGEYGCIGEDGPFSSSMNEVQRGIWLYWWGWTIFLLYEWSTTGNMVVLVRMDHFPPLWMKYNGEYGCIGEDGPFSSSMNEVQRGIWLYWWGWTIFLLYEWSTTGNMVVLVRMDHFPPLWMKYNGEYGCIGEDGPFSSSMNEVQRGIWLYWWGWTIFLLYEWSTTGNMVVLVRMDHFPPLWMKYNGEYGCIGEDGPFSSSMNEVQRGIWLYWWGWTIFLLYGWSTTGNMVVLMRIFLLYEWSTTGNMVVLVRMDHFPPLWMKYNGEYGCIGEDGPFSSSMNEVQRGIWLYWWGWTIFLLYEWSTTGNMVVLVRMDHFPPLWMKYNGEYGCIGEDGPFSSSMNEVQRGIWLY